LPLGALHNGPEAYQLQGVHGHTHFVAALLFRLASVTFQLDRPTIARAEFIAGPFGRLLEEIAVVAIQPRDFGGQSTLSFDLPPPYLVRQLSFEVVKHQRQQFVHWARRDRFDGVTADCVGLTPGEPLAALHGAA